MSEQRSSPYTKTWQRSRGAVRRGVALLGLAAGTAFAQSVVEVGPGHTRMAVPGRPFGVAFSRDGAALFVGLDDPDGGARGSGRLAVYAVGPAGTLRPLRSLPLAGGSGGLAVSHDGRLLAVSQRDAGVGFYDVDRLVAADPRPDAVVGVVATGAGSRPGRGSGTLAVGFSNDDALLLATDESRRA